MLRVSISFKNFESRKLITCYELLTSVCRIQQSARCRLKRVVDMFLTPSELVAGADRRLEVEDDAELNIE